MPMNSPPKHRSINPIRWALHWQILLGMIAGSTIGLALNFAASTRVSEMRDGLPSGVMEAVVDESSERTVVQYTRDDGEVIRYVVASLAGDDAGGGSVRSFEDLAERDATAAVIADSAATPARRIGAAAKRLGDLFLRMLKMVAVPLIIASLLTGILNLGTGAGVGRMFRRTVLYYLTTSMMAITTGLVVVNIVRPGLGGAAAGGAGAGEVHAAKPLGTVLFEQVEAMIPANVAAAVVEPNFLSIIAFTILFAVFALRCGEAVASKVAAASSVVLEVLMRMTMAIIHLAPLGVFFLMLAVTATQGPGVFVALSWYVLAVAAALAIHAFITLPIILRLVAKRSPTGYAAAMSPALLTAFSSASSNGTLPLTMTAVSERAGVSNRTGSFVLPLGATINMDGTALYEVVAVLFIAQMHFGVNLPLSAQIIVALTALLASVGAAGIPHAGLVMMAIILQAVGLPAELQGVILAVDRVLDMGRTAVNVWSDSCGCAVVERLGLGDDAAVTDPPAAAAAV